MVDQQQPTPGQRADSAPELLPLRGALLVEAARAYLQIGDPLAAGRALVEAERTASAEVRLRPVARTLITDLLRGGPVPADVAQLATALGIG
ncbi:hypothetical protein C5N14_26335 [Micromonospora sp. MW-13]|uniref:hypothetical protein n=1 Tax=Micromonospora sp. MW-13 TaxID=2094022 RepID=UPI000E43D37A|nr:hypothetical protein [Micromonospora sp. MW-13]RGC65873.1 hypothetical protein C5N14_26335 [Micromonospora sp. MW-13]